jgi:hypothetical protein
MPMGWWKMKYFMLAREDLTNQVEGRALRSKETSSVCKFLLEDVICRYGCIGKIVADRDELDANEAKEFFLRMGIKLSLTVAYNTEANGKVERRHSPIVKALVKACQGKAGEWPCLLLFALWADRTTQFRNRIYAGRTYFRSKTDHAGRAKHRVVAGIAMLG